MKDINKHNFINEKIGRPKHIKLSACETQDSEMQGRNRAHSQSAMGEGDDAADCCPPQEGASTTCLGLPKICDVGLAILQRPFFGQSIPLKNVRVLEEKSDLKLRSRKSGRSRSDKDPHEESEEIEGVAAAPPLEFSGVNALYRSMAMQAILPIPQFQKPAVLAEHGSIYQASSAKMFGTFENKENLLKNNSGTFTRALREEHPKSILQPANAFHDQNRKEGQPNLTVLNREAMPNLTHAIQAHEKEEAPSALSTLDLSAHASIEKSSISESNTSLKASSMLWQSPAIESETFSLASAKNAAPIKNETPLPQELLWIQREMASKSTWIQELQPIPAQSLSVEKSSQNDVPMQNSYMEKVLQNDILETKETPNSFAQSINHPISNLEKRHNDSILMVQEKQTQAHEKEHPLTSPLIPQNQILIEKQKSTESLMNLNQMLSEQSHPILTPKHESRTSADPIIQSLDSSSPKETKFKGIEARQMVSSAAIHKEKHDVSLSSFDKKTLEPASLFRSEGISPKTPLPTAEHTIPTAKIHVPTTNFPSLLAKPQAPSSSQKYSVERLISALKHITLSIFAHSLATPKIAGVDSLQTTAISENPPIVEHPEITQDEPPAAPEFTAKIYSQPVIIDDYWGVGRL